MRLLVNSVCKENKILSFTGVPAIKKRKFENFLFFIHQSPNPKEAVCSDKIA